MAKRKLRREIPRKNLLGKILFTVIFAFILLMIIRTIDKINSQKEVLENLKQTENALRINNEEMKRKIDKPVDNDYVADVVQDKLNYRKSSEILFYINSED